MCFPPCFGSFGSAVSEKKFFRNRPIRNKNCLWQPCLLTNREEMSIRYREPSIDASYQVSVRFIWQSSFRGEDFQKSNNQKQELPVVAMFVNESGRNEQSLQRNFHRCFLPNYFIWESGFRGEHFLEINQSETRMACGCHLC